MYLDLRAYLLVSKCHRANFISHCIYSGPTFSAKQMTFKVPGQTTSSQDGTDQEGCDSTVSYTQEEVCHLSHCR